MSPTSITTRTLIAITVLVSVAVSTADAQRVTRRIGEDSVVVIPGEAFAADEPHAALFGNNYRELWTLPIKVPVLNLATFHGGLTPTKEGGGMQAKNLHFVAPDSTEFVFRQVRKTKTILGDEYRHTVIEDIVKDQGSASHPTGAIAVPGLATAAHVLHATPKLYFMPDDPRLGEFRKDFANVLGMVEESPNKPKTGHTFAEASDLIDSKELLEAINKSAEDRVDARALLTARLLDMVMGDNDRHPDNWDWARFGKTGDLKIWEPVPTDRDKAFVSYEGSLLALARILLPALVQFRPHYPSGSALFANAGDFDRRLLAPLDKADWDSVATSLSQRLTDAVIDEAVRSMPREYVGTSLGIAATLKARRNGLRAAAAKYYDELWKIADIHGTDADDQATITRSGDGTVDIVLQSGNTAPYLSRRFSPAETEEIRLYLHGGNDRATVRGDVPRSIPLRIIGGNGTNTFVDESTVGGHRNPTHFYDRGTVTDVKYARDTVDERRNFDNAFNHSFNRRPWLEAYGTTIPPIRDQGSTTVPYGALHSQRGLGIYPEVGVVHYRYDFRKEPYATAYGASAAYSFASQRWRVRGEYDKRLEESDMHFPVRGFISQLEVLHFRGFGNDVPESEDPFFDLSQRQWQIFPAIGRALNSESDISIGPIVRYTTTDSVANQLISQARPYGFSTFGQAGARLRLHFDNRMHPDTLKPRFVVSLTGDAYPGIWDATKAYESLDAWAATYFTFPFFTKPVLALRGGGKKLWGPFPYFDAAFLGGSETIRTQEKQTFAGDASIYGTAELRVPIAKFPFLVPLDLGALGFMDAGRVYVDGESPGGWHSAAGAGLWAGYVNPGFNFNVEFTNDPDHRFITNFGFAF